MRSIAALLALAVLPPAAAGPHPGCAGCHLGDPGAGPTVSCASCHAGVERAPRGVASSHGDHGLDCVACHDPHGTAGTASLRDLPRARWAAPSLDAVSAFCTACHEDYGEDGASDGRRHPVGVPARRAALPLMDGPEGAVIGCLTCHVTHVSESRQLLRWPPGGMADACCTCHEVC